MANSSDFWVSLIGGAINAVAAVWPGLANRLAWRLFCYPPPWRPRDAEEARFKAHGEAILNTATRDNLYLVSGECVATYTWRAATGVARGRVVLVHGWTGTAASMAAFVAPLTSLGFDVVAIDMPGHGRSSGHRHSIDLGARVLIALDTALGPFDAAITHSHGGASFGASLGGLPTVQGSLRVARAAMIAPPNSVEKLVHDFADLFGLRKGVRSHLLARTRAAAGLALDQILIGMFVATAGPALFVVHDRDDAIVPFGEGEAIAAAAHGQLMATRGLGHRKIIADETVIARVAAFVAGAGG